MQRWPGILRGILLGGICCAAIGCGPDYNAISNRLREDNMRQEREISILREKLAARDVNVQQLQGQLDEKLPRVETLPADRLSQLYTAAKLEIRSTSDAWEIETGKGLTGFRIFIRTFSDDGTNIPATGSLTIEAFELPKAPAEPVRLGKWDFTPEKMKKNWYNGFALNQFAFNCPWTAPPKTADVTIKARFTDALTGKLLEAQLDKKIRLPK